MSECKRKIFTGAQKAKVALEYGVHPTQVARNGKRNAGSLFEGKRGPKPVNAHNNPLLWLPIIGMHLLFFSGLTLLNRLHNVFALLFHLHYSSRYHRRFWTGESTGLMAE